MPAESTLSPETDSQFLEGKAEFMRIYRPRRAMPFGDVELPTIIGTFGREVFEQAVKTIDQSIR